MKSILTFAIILSTSLTIYSQDFIIHEVEDDVDLSGTTVTVTGEDTLLHIDFQVRNESGATIVMDVERVKILEVIGTEDYLCWGPTCYSEDLVSPNDPFITPYSMELEVGASAPLQSYHLSNFKDGTAHYRYYLINEDGERLDSIDVVFDYTLSIEEEQNLTVSVYPNPATSIVNIELVENANNVAFNLYNVLGDKVMVRKLNAGNNAINVEALPNGVYFYSILQDGVITETKKLVVRH